MQAGILVTRDQAAQRVDIGAGKGHPHPLNAAMQCAGRNLIDIQGDAGFAEGLRKTSRHQKDAE